MSTKAISKRSTDVYKHELSIINPFDILSGKVFIDEDGYIYYFKDAGYNLTEANTPIRLNLHRINGPAIINKKGHTWYYLDGEEKSCPNTVIRLVKWLENTKDLPMPTAIVNMVKTRLNKMKENEYKPTTEMEFK